MFKIRTLIRYNQAYCEQQLGKLKLKHYNWKPVAFTVFYGSSLTSVGMIFTKLPLSNIDVIKYVFSASLVSILAPFCAALLRGKWYEYEIRKMDDAAKDWKRIIALDPLDMNKYMLLRKKHPTHPLADQIEIMCDIITETNKKC